jgi:MHS family shikimate/dehydroshikimate transporter-like MFS transporter
MATTAQRLGGQRSGDTQSLRQVALASFIGTTIEWYDFFLYGTAAALIFDKLFFPSVDPTIGTLAAFATFGVGFAARPLGGIIFGHFGDRAGRKSMLVISLLIMGIATAAIGVLPSYASIGIAAPIVLVVLRLAQGLGVGGEWGGAVLMSVEHAPKGKRGLYGSFPQMGVPAGLFLSTIVLVGVGLFIRMRIMESPAFQEVKDSGTEAPKPIVDVIKTQPREVLVAMGMRIAENGIFYVYTVFVLAYGEETLKLGKSTMLTGVALAAAVGLMTIPLWGRLSDRFGRKPMYMAGAVFSLLFCFPFFALVDTKEPVLIWLAIVLGVNVGHDLMYGPQAAYYSELFGTRVRYSGASLGYQLASVLSGGFAPLIAAALLAANDGSPTLVAAYMAVMGVITVVATAMAPETYRSEIREARPEERRFFREGEEGAVQPTRTRAQPVGR